MGGALGSIFSSVGQGPGFNDATGKYDPSALQKVTQGAAKGAGQGFGQSMQRQPAPGGGGGTGSPSSTPVDSGYFAPSAAPPGSPMTSGAPGMPQRMMPAAPSPFYGQ